MDYDWQIRQYRTPLRRYMTDSNACDYSPGIFEILQLKSDQASRSAGVRHFWMIGLSLLKLSILLGNETITVLCNGNAIKVGLVRSIFCFRLTSSTVDMRLYSQPGPSRHEAICYSHRSPGVPYGHNFAIVAGNNTMISASMFCRGFGGVSAITILTCLGHRT